MSKGLKRCSEDAENILFAFVIINRRGQRQQLDQFGRNISHCAQPTSVLVVLFPSRPASSDFCVPRVTLKAWVGAVEKLDAVEADCGNWITKQLVLCLKHT